MIQDSSQNPDQMNFLHADLLDQLNPRHPLLRLAKHIPWDYFETEFIPLYSDQGRPAKAIRLMVGLSILKHLENLSDEVLIDRWVRDPYRQVFCGETAFQWEFPCDPSDMTYFRKRIGSAGFEKIFAASVALHGESAIEEEMCIDTTVQEKNTTFPTDAKQYRKIHGHLLKLARTEGIQLSRTHEKEVKHLKQHTRFSSHPRNRKKARRAVKGLKTIAGRILREIQRQMNETQQQKHQETLSLYQRVLKQKRGDKNKIYSLHEPHIYCMSKGKDHKKYEFGTKASLSKTKNSNVLIGALAFDENRYDGHTLPDAFSQIERILGHVPKICLGDRGYRGKSKIDNTRIHTPKPPRKNASKALQDEMRKRFQRRAAIEPVIGHLKSDHRLNRNFLKGFVGDQINLLMAAAAFNFKKWMREVYFWLANIRQIFSWIISPADQWQNSH
jgi:IS5 family transposase